MTDHKVVSREDWQAARDELLGREKEHTRMGDCLLGLQPAVAGEQRPDSASQVSQESSFHSYASLRSLTAYT